MELKENKLRLTNEQKSACQYVLERKQKMARLSYQKNNLNDPKILHTPPLNVKWSLP